VDNPREALDANYDAVMKELLKEVGNRLWRNRESACLAIADLMQGRRWAELGAHLEEIWTMALRALDDIKDSVRTAAHTLMRSVKGISLRLCDVSMTPPSEASKAVRGRRPNLGFTTCLLVQCDVTSVYWMRG
jgi:proteasome component ECM29